MQDFPGGDPFAGLDTTATDSLSGSIIACAVVSFVVSGLMVGLRFYSRGVVTRVLGREDWCVLVAWVRTELPLSPSLLFPFTVFLHDCFFRFIGVVVTQPTLELGVMR